MKRSKRKQALTNRMAKVGLHWTGVDTRHGDGYYHVIIESGFRDTRLRTLDEVEGYVKALEQVAISPPTLAGDILCDFWADLAA